MRHFYHSCCKFCTLTINCDHKVRYVSETRWIRLEHVLTGTVSLDDMSWKRLGDIFVRRLEDVLKTSWRHLRDFLKTSWQDVLKTSWKRLEGVLKTYDHNEYIRVDQDVLKMSWRRLLKTKTKDVFKTSSKRLQDIFIKTNVCWGCIREADRKYPKGLCELHND